MPSGRRFSLLRASAHPKSATELTGWATPSARDGKDCSDPSTWDCAEQRDRYDQLGRQVHLAGWPAPTKGNADGSQAAAGASPTGKREDGSKATVALPSIARLAGWGTPTCQDARHATLSPSGRETRPEQPALSGGAGGVAGADGGNAGAERLQRSGEHGLVAQDGRPPSGVAGPEDASWADERVGDGPPGQHVCLPVGAGSGIGGRYSAARSSEAATGDAGAAGDRADMGRPGPVNGFWRASDWLYCRDDKWRPVEPGTFPLASGATARVGRLRAYGNAICVPQAVAFIEAVMSLDSSVAIIEKGSSND